MPRQLTPADAGAILRRTCCRADGLSAGYPRGMYLSGVELTYIPVLTSGNGPWRRIRLDAVARRSLSGLSVVGLDRSQKMHAAQKSTSHGQKPSPE